MSPNDADGMANSVDTDQTAPLGAVWSGSALFAQAYLSENWNHIVLNYRNVPKFLDRQVWGINVDPGSTLFAILSALFRCITPWKIHISQILG